MREIGPDAYRDELEDAHRAGDIHPSQNCPLCHAEEATRQDDARCDLLVDLDGRCYDDDCPVHGDTSEKR